MRAAGRRPLVGLPGLEFWMSSCAFLTIYWLNNYFRTRVASSTYIATMRLKPVHSVVDLGPDMLRNLASSTRFEPGEETAPA